MTDTLPQSHPQPQPQPRRRRALRAVAWCLGVALVLAIVLAVGIATLKGRALTAPDWLQARIEARIAQVMPQARVAFGAMVFVVDEGWVPKVALRDITVRTPTGEEIVSFNEFKGTFALRPLLNGVVQPRAISLSGVFVTLQRDELGRVSLSAGSGAAPPMHEAATLPQLIGQLDQALTSDALIGLTQADLQSLTLRYVDLRANRAWTVDGGRLRLDRDGDDLTLGADLAVLSGGAGVATLAASYQSTIGDGAANFGINFDSVPAQDIAAQGPAFAWLDVLRAQISGSVRSGIDAEGMFGPINASLQIGAGAVQPNEQTKPIPFEGARSYFSYDPDARLLRFDELSVRSKWVTGQATGTAALGVDDTDGALSDLVGQFNLQDLSANPQDLYPEPVSVATADLDFQMKLDPFRLQLGRLQISDEGQTLLVDGALAAGDAGWQLSLDAQMDGLQPARLLALWPVQLKSKTRGWLAKNLLQGQLSNIDVAYRRAPDSAPRLYLGFDYADATVRFMDTMPPVTDGKGHMSLLENRLVVTLDDGQVVAPEGGGVALQGSSFIIPDVRASDGTPAVVRLETRSSLTAALSLLNQKPMQVMDKIKMPVALADGQAALRGTLALPLKRGGKASDVQYHVEGDLLALHTDRLVPDRTLHAAKLKVTADNSSLIITGRGNIDGVAFDGTWSQPIGAGSDKSTLRGQVTLDQKTLDTFGIALPQGTVSGAGIGRIALDFHRGAPPHFSLGSDLHGLRVSVPQLSWVKPRNTAGKLRVSGVLGAVPKVEKLEIEGAGLSAKGAVTLKPGGALDRVRFERLQVGDWLDVPVDLNGQGAGKAVQVVLRGGKLDLRRAEFGGADASGTSGPPGPPMEVQLDRLQITNTIALTNMRGKFGTARGLDGSFQALLNGGAPVQGQVIPQNGRSAVRLVSSDAGGVLRSAGLLKQVVGGNLSLTLLPVGSGGAFDGRITADGIRIKDAPGIAALLNAISVVGLVNELNGDGIYFDNVEGDFRLTPDRLTLTKSSAVGASMGLSMDGVYALKSGIIQMQGVISPVYLLNGIGSVLTRKGEGVIGFNYTLTGAASAPKVSVNPLSALAPGLFREIFRKPPPTLPAVEGVTDSTLPNATPKKDKPVVSDQEGR